MSKHLELGKAGEEQAHAYLRGKGHVLLEINYRFGHKEVDVISLSGDILVFTEIKTRSSYALGFPEEAVHERKQQWLKATAEHYCLQYPSYEKLRFDVISILLQHGRVIELLHFEDAFY
ncbi:YraN family protein [Taibaiella koreensis]|uniref:YraN family protein n=1 Tax=Taibaiella koreensis TaxID=1268548 RepID=UPI000E59DE06|nr:YraN family protein [Taibaiella koreensis]